MDSKTNEAKAACSSLQFKQRHCYLRESYSSPAKQERKCGGLFAEWQACLVKQLVGAGMARDAARVQAKTLKGHEIHERQRFATSGGRCVAPWVKKQGEGQGTKQ